MTRRPSCPDCREPLRLSGPLTCVCPACGTRARFVPRLSLFTWPGTILCVLVALTAGFTESLFRLTGGNALLTCLIIAGAIVAAGLLASLVAFYRGDGSVIPK